jgi:hypothetical protein
MKKKAVNARNVSPKTNIIDISLYYGWERGGLAI